MDPKKTYVILFLFFLSVALVTSGGRIASSDETAFFLETQSLLDHGTFAISDSIVNNGSYGPDGKFYVGGGPGYTLVSIPFYLAGKLIVSIAPIPESLRIFVLKGAFSLTNQFVFALIGLVFFLWCRSLGWSRRFSFFMTCALLFTTNLFPYAKSAMREPLLTLGVMGVSYGLWQFKTNRIRTYLHIAGISIVTLLITKVSFFAMIPCFLGYFVLIWDEKLFQRWTVREIVRDKLALLRLPSFWSDLRILLAWIGLGIAITAVYNTLLFGNATTSGYSKNVAPFSNPLLVGLYGLLFSSGKSFFLYAPMTVLTIWALPSFWRSHFRESMFFMAAFLILLILHAKFFAWAGDGSWGPRYLIPVLPFPMIIVGKWLNDLRSRARIRRIAIGLAVLGVVIQAGGTTVYLGSYLRYIGEWPSPVAFDHPEFMYKSHFVPGYAPVTGHWELLGQSLRKHIDGEIGPIRIANADRRLPLSASDQEKITYFIDYWFMYMYYAGVSIAWILWILILALIVTGVLAVMCWRTMKNQTEITR